MAKDTYINQQTSPQENKGYSLVLISLISKLSELKIMKWLLVLNFELTRPVFPI